MKICIVGKFSPIQGGVSMRTYRTAHALAARGHEVHVVTNAKEAQPPFRMHMRPEDWRRCEPRYADGSVTVHWTDPVDRSQSYIPMASPFVSKLAGVAARVHAEHRFDVIYSHYLEPYGVAAHLASQMTGMPHVARMAGSDAGRLRHHPQLDALYDHVLRSAALVIAGGAVAARAVERGVAPERIASGGSFTVPNVLFTPEGPVLDLAALRAEAKLDAEIGDVTWGGFSGDRPHFGICGKLGDSKGSFALLDAMQRLKRENLDIGLVALAHGQPAVEKRFRARVRKLGLAERVLQIPFIPHWRVPEFLRGCLAVCCLEQDFPVVFHTPIIPLEVLLCGACMVGSTEVLRKFPGYGPFVDGYTCVAIRDVSDVEALAAKLAAIVQDPKPAAALGKRGASFVRELQQRPDFPQSLETALIAAAERKPIRSTARKAVEPPALQPEGACFPLTRLAEKALAKSTQPSAMSGTPPAKSPIDFRRPRQVLDTAHRAIRSGRKELEVLAAGVQIEVSIAQAESEADTTSEESFDPLFRLRIQRWAIDDGDLAELVPLRDPRLRVIEFDYDVADFMHVHAIADLPPAVTEGPSHMVVFGRCSGERRNPLVIDAMTARILQLSDGTRTASEIATEVAHAAGNATDSENITWLETLFLHGLISLTEAGNPTSTRHHTRVADLPAVTKRRRPSRRSRSPRSNDLSHSIPKPR